MSPRAACRLETLGFEHVYDYLPGKVDWLARNLPTHGEHADRPTAGGLARTDALTVTGDEDLAGVRARLDQSPYSFALVVSPDQIVLGRLRASTLPASDAAIVEEAMEPGPSTVRPHLGADELLERLRSRNLTTAIVTTPEGRLVGVVHRQDLEQANTTGGPGA